MGRFASPTGPGPREIAGLQRAREVQAQRVDAAGRCGRAKRGRRLDLARWLQLGAMVYGKGYSMTGRFGPRGVKAQNLGLGVPAPNAGECKG